MLCYIGGWFTLQYVVVPTKIHMHTHSVNGGDLAPHHQHYGTIRRCIFTGERERERVIVVPSPIIIISLPPSPRVCMFNTDR